MRQGAGTAGGTLSATGATEWQVMGARNVGMFLANAASLSPNAHRLGVFMAWHSLDDSAGTQYPEMVGLYGRGWRYAAQLLWPDKAPDTARKAYTRGVAELVARGFIVAQQHPHRGQRQHYRMKM